MNWSDERYVRVYTRDTADLLSVGWEGRLVLYELLRKADRAGVLDTGGDLGVMPEMLRIPVDVFNAGFMRLRSRGVIDVTDSAIVIPNFLEAQESKQSDKARQRESRLKRADVARSKGENPSLASRPDRYAHSPNDGTGVTERDPIGSQDVTNGHSGSQRVTAGHSVPIRAVPIRAVPCLNTLPDPVGVDGAPPALELGGDPPPAVKPADLEAVYQLYPRKEGKGIGLAKARKDIRTPADLGAFRLAVTNYAAKMRAESRATQHIKAFDTFMGCWEDYVDPVVAAADTQAPPSAATGYVKVTGREQYRGGDVEDF